MWPALANGHTATGEGTRDTSELLLPYLAVFLTLNLDVMPEYKDSLWQLLNSKKEELHAKRVERENRNSLETNHDYSFNGTVNDYFSRSP